MKVLFGWKCTKSTSAFLENKHNENRFTGRTLASLKFFKIKIKIPIGSYKLKGYDIFNFFNFLCRMMYQDVNVIYHPQAAIHTKPRLFMFLLFYNRQELAVGFCRKVCIYLRKKIDEKLSHISWTPYTFNRAAASPTTTRQPASPLLHFSITF